jgi:hypothetical protein
MGRFYRSSKLVSFFKKLPVTPAQDKRRHCRKRCFLEIEYSVRSYTYKGFIQNISEGGAYVRSRKARWFLSGEDIALRIPLRILGDQIKGKIAWTRPHGMGIMFEKSSSARVELMPPPGEVPTAQVESRRTGKIRSRRVHWEPSASDDVTRYRLYWSTKGAVGYDSDHADVGNVTQINLPDAIPCFPLVGGEIELGITAISQAGNESEIAKAVVHFDFRIPEAPRNLKVDGFINTHEQVSATPPDGNISPLHPSGGEG